MYKYNIFIYALFDIVQVKANLLIAIVSVYVPVQVPATTHAVSKGIIILLSKLICCMKMLPPT